MAQGSRAHRGRGRTSKGKSQRTAHGLNDAYQDMLNEANSSPTQTSDEGRTVKKRRVRGRIVAQSDTDGSLTKLSPEGRSLPTASHVDRSSENSTVKFEPTHPLQQEQTAYDVDYDVDCSEESDFAWEEVGLTHGEAGGLDDPLEEQQEQQLDLVLDEDGGEDTASPAVARKKSLTALERKLRLEVHKVHLLCLLSHVHMRNHWCNDQNIHVCSHPYRVYHAWLRNWAESFVPACAQASSFTSQSRRTILSISPGRVFQRRSEKSLRLFPG